MIETEQQIILKNDTLFKAENQYNTVKQLFIIKNKLKIYQQCFKQNTNTVY